MNGRHVSNLLLGSSLSLLLVAAAVPADDNSPVPGKWVRRGPPLVGAEYPACYQFWVCVPATAPDEAARTSRQRPVGSWGSCANVLRGADAGCGDCLVAPPEQPCTIATDVAEPAK